MWRFDGLLRRYAWWRKWRGLPEPMSPAIALITREALRILHDKARFVGAIDRQYDQPGKALTIRKPNQYTRRA
jgi:hypothetical protein